MASFIKSEQRICEMEENAKIQDGNHKMLSISISKSNKLHVLLHLSTYRLQVNILWYVNDIFCSLDQFFMLFIQFTPTFFPTFYKGLLFTGVNRLSNICNKPPKKNTLKLSPVSLTKFIYTFLQWPLGSRVMILTCNKIKHMGNM